MAANMSAENPPSRREIAEARLWAELARVCRTVHDSWYITRDRISGERLLRQLERILKSLPESDMAIVRQDALAWFHQLRGDNAAAIQHRQEEIRLIELLHDDVRRHVDSGKYDRRTAEYVLDDRDLKNLQERQAMLRALEEEARIGNRGPDGLPGTAIADGAE
jgi:hypothetical protein